MFVTITYIVFFTGETVNAELTVSVLFIPLWFEL